MTPWVLIVIGLVFVLIGALLFGTTLVRLADEHPEKGDRPIFACSA
jgi:hypothetical protein